MSSALASQVCGTKSICCAETCSSHVNPHLHMSITINFNTLPVRLRLKAGVYVDVWTPCEGICNLATIVKGPG